MPQTSTEPRHGQHRPNATVNTENTDNRSAERDGDRLTYRFAQGCAAPLARDVSLKKRRLQDARSAGVLHPAFFSDTTPPSEHV